MARTKKKRDIELDAHGRAARDSEGSQNQQGDTPDFVKLTDISDIVSKYAVVDKLFTDEEQNDDEKPGAQAPDTVEAHSEQVIDEDEFEAEEDDTHVPERVEAKAEPVPEPEEAFEEEDEDEDVFESPASNEALEAVAEPADHAIEEFDDEEDEEFDDTGDTGDTGPQRETEESVTRARAHVALLREAREARAEARRHGGQRTAAKRSDDEDDGALPDRPTIVFRRPRLKDELNSNWSDNAHRAFDDIRGELRDARAQPQPYAIRSSSENILDDDDPEDIVEPVPVIARHRATLSRSIALSVGLPIATGALFALLLYYQQDFKPNDVWNWVVATTTSETEQTPNAAPAAPTAETATAPAETDTRAVAKVAPEATPSAASPEPGLSVTPPKSAENAVATAPAAAPAVAQTKKQVYMARLTVTDSQGTSLDPIPLSLSVAPAAPEQRLRVRVSGLPDGARLSAGTDLGHGEWVLSQNELGGLTMTLPAGFTGQITLLAEVIDDATHIQAAPSKTMEVKVAPGQMRVEPTAAAATKPRSFAEATAVPVPAPTGEAPTEEAPAGSQTSPFSQLQVQAPTRQSTEAETQAALPVPKPAAETPKAEAAAQPEPEKTAPKEELVVQPEAEKTAPKAEVVTQPEPQAAPPEPEVAAQPAPEAPAPETKVAVLTPPAQTEPAPAAPASSKSPLLTKGDELMNLGDIASARLLYQRALKAGDPRAATALGKSYDPMVFEQLKVHGVLPDANIAIEWYQRGAEGGDVEAASHLQALTTWLKR